MGFKGRGGVVQRSFSSSVSGSNVVAYYRQFLCVFQSACKCVSKNKHAEWTPHPSTCCQSVTLKITCLKSSCHLVTSNRCRVCICVCVYVCFFCSLLITGMGNQWVLSHSLLLLKGQCFFVFFAWHAMVVEGRGKETGVWSMCCAFPSVWPSSTLLLHGFEQLAPHPLSNLTPGHQPGNLKGTFILFSQLACDSLDSPAPDPSNLPPVPKLEPCSSVYSICLFDFFLKRERLLA